MKRIYLVIAALVLCAPNANAKDFGEMGLGLAPCAQFAKMYAMNPTRAEDMFLDWAQGFMSGMNMGALIAGKPSKNMASISVQEQEELIRQYCNKHPLAEYGQAVMSVFIRFPFSSSRTRRH